MLSRMYLTLYKQIVGTLCDIFNAIGGLTKNLFDLTGRIAFVTGGSGHLGKAICEGLCSAGAHVIINGRNRDKTEAAASEFKANRFSAEASVGDITDENYLVDIFSEIRDKHQRLDIIVNNAYKGKTNTPESVANEDFQNAFQIAVAAAYRIIMLGRELMKNAAFKRNGTSTVINIATMYGVISPDPSIYGKTGLNNPPDYGAAKAGLIQLTRYAACHFAKDGIRVNSISPGPFPSPAIRRQQPDFIETLSKRNPLGRVGDSWELAGPVQFLASDASSYITGINIPVDGGWTAW